METPEELAAIEAAEKAAIEADEKAAADKAAADKAAADKAAADKAAADKPKKGADKKAESKGEAQASEVARIFEVYPKENTLWETKDGYFFLSQLEAVNHSKMEGFDADTITVHNR